MARKVVVGRGRKILPHLVEHIAWPIDFAYKASPLAVLSSAILSFVSSCINTLIPDLIFV